MTGPDDRPTPYGESGHQPINAVLAEMHAEHQAAGEPCPDWCPYVADAPDAESG